MDPINPIAGNPEATGSVPETPEIPQVPKDNHWITILSMALFVLLSLGAVAFLYYQNQQLKSMLASYQAPADSPTPSATTDPTANWKTYSNSEFSFKFPPNLAQDKSGLVGGTFLGNPKTITSFADQSTVREGTDAPFNGFTVYQLTNPESTIEAYIKKEIAARKDSPRGIYDEEIKSIKVAGKTSFYIDTEQNLKQYFIPLSNSKIILFSTVRQTDEFLPNLDQILSTFKFIESTSSASPTAVPKACTQEAKLCPDGSYVGRTGPNCEFSACL